MIAIVKRGAGSLGIDKAIAFTVLSRLVQIAGGFVSVVFIARFLSLEEQGFYFTFSSIVALQIFFELGLSSIISQFTAHEMAHLQWDEHHNLVGDIQHRSRLSSLLHFITKWFSVLSVLLVVTLFITGYIFFSRYGANHHQVNWKLPWLLVSVTTGTALFISPFLSFFEGLGKVKEVAQLRLVQQSVQTFGLLSLLALHGGLFANPVANFAGIAIVIIAILLSYRFIILKNIRSYKVAAHSISFKKEIFPYQWRIAISWISGFFIFQLFNPIVFANEGAVVAGKLGITLAALSGITALSINWINTKVPLFSSLIALKKYAELDKVFWSTLKQCISVTLALLAGFVLVIAGGKYLHIPFTERFLPLQYVMIFSAVTLINQVSYALATYVRCHKKEPFLLLSVVSAVVMCAAMFLFGRRYGIAGLAYSYLIIMGVLNFIFILKIFITKRQLWHNAHMQAI